MAPPEERTVAPLPARAAGPLKLPLLAPFDSPESIVQALAVRDIPLLTAGLVQVEKRALALVAKAAPRASADPLLDYLAKYPTVDGVFAAWDTAHKTNNSQLSAVVLAALSALVRLVSTDPFASDPEIIRRLLSQYGSHLDRALNPGRNDVTVAALKLCNVVVAFGSGRFARRLFGSMAWQPKIITRLFRTRLKDTSRDPLQKPDIRTLLTMLVLAFLSAGDSRLKSEVFEVKALLAGIMKGLSEDPLVVVNHVLVALWREVVSDRSVGLEARRHVFDEPCVVELVKLYSIGSDDEESPQHPRASVHRFLYTLTDWLAVQINDSRARSFGPQKVLGTVLRNLKVTEDPQQRELGLYILTRSPILAGPFWARFPSSLDPRLSSRWISAITFATQVISLPVDTHLSVSPSSTLVPPSLSSVLDTIIPPSLNKIWFSKALQHEAPLVSFLASLCLLSVLQKATAVLATLAESSRLLEEVPSVGRWASLAVRLREHLRSILPDPQIIVALMQKTAHAPATTASMAGVRKASLSISSTKRVATSAEAPAANDESSGRHLRTNVALRLLWLYHRAVPSVISTLRFDFAKLPQAHVAPTDAEGLRAISSAYALRLAAVHSSGGNWSRPGDHFKTTLAPLFKLYRTPSTPSNRHLLLSILARLLSTSTLFGTNQFEVDIWLSALPEPTSPSPNGVLDFFEQCVQKSLTSPEAADAEGLSTIKLSPLLKTVIAGLSSELATRTGGERSAMLDFVKRVVFGFIGASAAIELPKRVVASVTEVLDDDKTSDLLKDCVESLGARIDGTVATLLEDGSSSSPSRENIFASISSTELLTSTLRTMSTELIFLHVRPHDLADPRISLALLELIGSRASWEPATRVLLHRFVGVPWTEIERDPIIAFFVEIHTRAVDERVRSTLRKLLFGPNGLLPVFSLKKAPHASITSLLEKLLTASSSFDTTLVQPYCAIMLNDARSAAQKKKLSPRMLASTPLLAFFDDDAAVSFVSALLARPAEQLEPQAAHLLDVALLRVSGCAPTSAYRSMWTTHFVALHRLSIATFESAGIVLANGAQTLLPFSISNATTSSPAVSDTNTWRSQASSWTTELLSQDRLTSAQAAVLAALLFRSSESRTQFSDWISKHASTGVEEYADGAEAALGALLEVCAARGESPSLPDAIATRFTHRLLTQETTTATAANLRGVIRLMCTNTTNTASAVLAALESSIPKLDRDVFLPGVLGLLTDLCEDSPRFAPVLDAFINGSFAGLVRRFAEYDEDTATVSQFVDQLYAVVIDRGRRSAYKSHLLDPLVTAAITRRLNQPGPTLLAAALCQNHTWKENEVTRHLNSVFASSHFHSSVSAEARIKNTESAMLHLVTALANAAPSAAASARFVERLMPFYRGSKSTNDEMLLDVFQRIELVSGVPVSTAFKSWNPSLDQSLLEPTRAATLRALQAGYVRRSWLAVCASSSTRFTKYQDDVTYDPRFILSYLHQTLVEDEFKAQDWTGLLQTGILGLPIAALASSSASARLLARATLAVALKKLTGTPFREKDEVALVLNHARNCVFSRLGEAIPSVIALFLANCMAAIGSPGSIIYLALNRFLLQRPLLDQRDLPMFYHLFYSASEEPNEDHKWLLRFMAEGLDRSQDWRIYRRRQTFELLASLLLSSRQNPALRKLVLQFLIRATAIPQAAKELLARNGLLGWLLVQAPVDASERRLLVEVVSNVANVLSHDRIGNVCDALDALCLLYGNNDVPAHETSVLCQTLAKLVSFTQRSTSAADTRRLVLERVRHLLTAMARRLPDDAASQIDFYRIAMLFGFAWESTGSAETIKEREVFTAGVRAGLAAGVAGLRKEIIRSQSS